MALIQFPDHGVYCGRGVRLSRAVDEEPRARRGRVFNLLPAAVFAVPVVATGLAAWQWALEGQKLKGILLMQSPWSKSTKVSAGQSFF
jgi:hypothetical protein